MTTTQQVWKEALERFGSAVEEDPSMAPELYAKLPDVVIDGVRYGPVGPAGGQDSTPVKPTESTARIGIAITTHNRPDVLQRCLNAFFECGWPGPIVVVDDASELPAEGGVSEATRDLVEFYRFDTNVGIAKAKNKCIELLMERGVEHLFIFDDDTYPIAADWWKPYVEHSEPHFCYLFKDPPTRRGGPPRNTPPTLYDDGQMYALGWPRGAMLYMHRSVIERVGGYRPEFGRWGWEHLEFSERVCNAGLTLMPFQDVRGSEKLIRCIDQDWNQPTGFKRSVPDTIRARELKTNEEVYQQFVGTSDYVEYRDLPNLVLTACLTKVADPQPSRRGAPKLTAADFETWTKSLKGCLPLVCHDIEDGDRALPVPNPQGWRRVPSGANPYVQRWVAYYQTLKQMPAKWVFCTDGTDVEMLREPWGEMMPGTLYVGWEPKVVGDKWLAQFHPPYKQWIDDHGGLPMLNAGVVGGDHATVMEFAHDVAHEGLKVDHSNLAGDMAALNFVAYSDKWRNRIFTGPLVTTTFKANERNAWSWFRHK